ncbi:hypothetical protein MUK42_33354 [Musa troglodytarum]|uniref:Uncharacterized protein n=1 Tax=Musa troglodytarum TaxID=320322 RepID=A0A9E7GAK2_9LILI|nr:hypothetical protein MUK42_33354 [Musa troglodytarum]
MTYDSVFGATSSEFFPEEKAMSSLLLAIDHNRAIRWINSPTSKSILLRREDINCSFGHKSRAFYRQLISPENEMRWWHQLAGYEQTISLSSNTRAFGDVHKK